VVTDKPHARPRQATMAAGLIMVGSVFVVLLAFQQMSTLGSIEAQEAAADLISEPPGDGLGLRVDDVQMIMRVMSLIAGACGAAAAILGYQVLQRSKSARVALSFIAPVLFLAGLSAAGFVSALVAAAVAMLWLQPTRDWYAGRVPVAVIPAVPTPIYASSTPATPSYPMMATAQSPTPPGAPGRPGRVAAACIVTITSSAITLTGLAITLIYMASERSTYVDFVDDALADQELPEGVTVEMMADVLVGFVVVMMVWSLIAIVLGALTMRGSNAARITLLVSAAMSGFLSLLGILGVFPLVITAASVATIVLLVSGDANAWFRARANRP